MSLSYILNTFHMNLQYIVHMKLLRFVQMPNYVSSKKDKFCYFRETNLTIFKIKPLYCCEKFILVNKSWYLFQWGYVYIGFLLKNVAALFKCWPILNLRPDFHASFTLERWPGTSCIIYLTGTINAFLHCTMEF